MEQVTAKPENGETASKRMDGGRFRRIGWVLLLHPKTFRRQFETALWWRKIACEPQVVSLMSDGLQVCWSFDGVVEESHTPSRLGAYTSANPSDLTDVGKAETFSASGYAYWLAEKLGTGASLEDLEIQLDRGYGVASKTHRRWGAGGEEVTLWHFTMPGVGHPLELRQTGRVRDPERYGMANVTFAVTYFGEDRGTVTVAVSDHFSQDGGHADAMRAAEALVFASASPSGS